MFIGPLSAFDEFDTETYDPEAAVLVHQIRRLFLATTSTGLPARPCSSGPELHAAA
jgi:hypothetical protein